MQKIPTIFKRDFSHTYQVLDEVNPPCAWVFDEDQSNFKIYRKWQGMSALILDGEYYKRAVIKKDQIIPTSFILCTTDQQSGKQFGWVLVDFENPQDQYYAEAFNPNLPDGTYELCGPKIFGNPEKMQSHILIDHTSFLVDHFKITYKELKTFFSLHEYEGLVFHHSDGRMAKIKKKDFGMTR